MDFLDKINTKNYFGNIMPNNNNYNMVNIIFIIFIIIFIIILIVCFSANNDTFSSDNTCYLVIRNGCGFAKKAHEQFKNNGMKLGPYKVKVIDLNNVKSILGNNINDKINGATPALVCKDKVILGLKSHEDYLNDILNLDEKDILFIGNMNCPFCIKAKKLMDDLNIKYNFILSNEPEGKRYMEEKQSNGVPLIINNKNNTHIVGFDEIKIRNLKN